MMTPEEKAELKRKVACAQVLKGAMSDEEKIRFLNTPYRDMNPVLRPGMVKNPQKFKFVQMTKNHIGEQKETFGARLIRYRSNFHLTREQFCDIANEFGSSYGVRITKRDMSNYEDFNVCPKIDKMTVIAQTMELPIEYFAGYGPSNRKPPKYRKYA